MNELQKLQATAGQKIHETIYGATWIWNDQQFPCTHGDIMQNPPLMTGGFSPNTEVTVTVRTELLGDSFPKKGDPCSLVINDKNKTFALQVQTIFSVIGDPFIKMLCMDLNQGA